VCQNEPICDVPNTSCICTLRKIKKIDFICGGSASMCWKIFSYACTEKQHRGVCYVKNIKNNINNVGFTKFRLRLNAYWAIKGYTLSYRCSRPNERMFWTQSNLNRDMQCASDEIIDTKQWTNYTASDVYRPTFIVLYARTIIVDCTRSPTTVFVAHQRRRSNWFQRNAVHACAAMQPQYMGRHFLRACNSSYRQRLSQSALISASSLRRCAWHSLDPSPMSPLTITERQWPNPLCYSSTMQHLSSFRILLLSHNLVDTILT